MATTRRSFRTGAGLVHPYTPRANNQPPNDTNTAPSTNRDSTAASPPKPPSIPSLNFDRINSQIDDTIGRDYGTTAKQRAKSKQNSAAQLASELRQKYISESPHQSGARRQPAGPKVPVDSMKTHQDQVVEKAKSKMNLREQDPSIQRTLTDLVPNRSLAPTVAPNIRLGPTLGRTVEVNDRKKMDLGRAFRMLEIRCSQNGVRRDFNKQRFHERPGMRRKRLKSERWRARFKTNFKQVIRRVDEMRRKGW